MLDAGGEEVRCFILNLVGRGWYRRGDRFLRKLLARRFEM